MAITTGLIWSFKQYNICRFNTYVVDGHDVEVLCKAFHDGSTVTGRPTCLVAKTFKGKGIPGEWNLTFKNIACHWGEH